MNNAPPPANAVELPETMKFSKNVDFETVATEDSTDSAPPFADASAEIDETELLKKVQPRIFSCIRGGEFVLNSGSFMPSHTDARYEVPDATAPPVAVQPLPEHVAVPKENEDDSTVTEFLNLGSSNKVLTADKNPPIAEQRSPKHRTVECVKTHLSTTTFPDRTDSTPPRAWLPLPSDETVDCVKRIPLRRLQLDAAIPTIPPAALLLAPCDETLESCT
jgi:hypothetical protein